MAPPRLNRPPRKWADADAAPLHHSGDAPADMAIDTCPAVDADAEADAAIERRWTTAEQLAADVASAITAAGATPVQQHAWRRPLDAAAHDPPSAVYLAWLAVAFQPSTPPAAAAAAYATAAAATTPAAAAAAAADRPRQGWEVLTPAEASAYQELVAEGLVPSWLSEPLPAAAATDAAPPRPSTVPPAASPPETEAPHAMESDDVVHRQLAVLDEQIDAVDRACRLLEQQLRDETVCRDRLRRATTMEPAAEPAGAAPAPDSAIATAADAAPPSDGATRQCLQSAAAALDHARRGVAQQSRSVAATALVHAADSAQQRFVELADAESQLAAVVAEGYRLVAAQLASLDATIDEQRTDPVVAAGWAEWQRLLEAVPASYRRLADAYEAVVDGGPAAAHASRPSAPRPTDPAAACREAMADSLMTALMDVETTARAHCIKQLQQAQRELMQHQVAQYARQRLLAQAVEAEHEVLRQHVHSLTAFYDDLPQPVETCAANPDAADADAPSDPAPRPATLLHHLRTALSDTRLVADPGDPADPQAVVQAAQAAQRKWTDAAAASASARAAALNALRDGHAASRAAMRSLYHGAATRWRVTQPAALAERERTLRELVSLLQPQVQEVQQGLGSPSAAGGDDPA